MAHILKLKSRIPARLAELHKTQGWLAMRLGVGPGYASRLAQGKVVPRVSTAYRLAAILQCTIEDLWLPVEE